MQTWIIGLVLLGIVLPLISSQDLNDKELIFEVKGYRIPSRNWLESYDDDDDDDNKETRRYEDNNPETEIDGDDDDDDGDGTIGAHAQDAAGILVKDTDLNAHAGILVIRNGVPPNSPVLYELRPVAPDQKNQYFQVVEDTSPIIMDKEDLEDQDYNNNKNEESDLDDYEEEDPVDTIRRQRPTTRPIQKRKQRPVKPNQKPNRKLNRKPNRRPNRPFSVATRPKPDRRRNQIQDQNKKRKGINNRISRPSGIRRNQNNSIKKNSNKIVNSNSNKNRVIASNINQGSGVNTVSNTMTTTETGTANDVPDVNYIIINKPSTTSTTERPFWGLLGRDAKDIGTPRS